MNDRAQRGPGEVPRLRNLTMIENIRRAEDQAWCERLEQQQVVARLGRMFGRSRSRRCWTMRRLGRRNCAQRRSLRADLPGRAGRAVE